MVSHYCLISSNVFRIQNINMYISKKNTFKLLVRSITQITLKLLVKNVGSRVSCSTGAGGYVLLNFARHSCFWSLVDLYLIQEASLFDWLCLTPGRQAFCLSHLTFLDLETKTRNTVQFRVSYSCSVLLDSLVFGCCLSSELCRYVCMYSNVQCT